MRIPSERRWLIIVGSAVAAVVLLAALVAVVASGAFESKVQVESGTRTVCRYGHVVSRDVKTLEVPASKVANYTVNERIITCPKHQAFEKLNAEAQALIKKGDYKGAAAKLKAMLALDPGNVDVQRQLAEVESGRRPATSSTSGGAGGAPGGGEEPVGPVAALGDFLPDTLAGYRAGRITVDPLVLTREYSPVSVPQVVRLVIVAEQFKDAAAAKAALGSQVKRYYARDRSTVPSGEGPAYFGTDGRRFAVAGVNSGSILVVAEATAKGVDPAKLKDELAAVMAAITK